MSDARKMFERLQLAYPEDMFSVSRTDKAADMTSLLVRVIKLLAGPDCYVNKKSVVLTCEQYVKLISKFNAPLSMYLEEYRCKYQPLGSSFIIFPDHIYRKIKAELQSIIATLASHRVDNSDSEE